MSLYRRPHQDKDLQDLEIWVDPQDFESGMKRNIVISIALDNSDFSIFTTH